MFVTRLASKEIFLHQIKQRELGRTKYLSAPLHSD